MISVVSLPAHPHILRNLSKHEHHHHASVHDRHTVTAQLQRIVKFGIGLNTLIRALLTALPLVPGVDNYRRAAYTPIIISALCSSLRWPASAHARAALSCSRSLLTRAATEKTRGEDCVQKRILS